MFKTRKGFTLIELLVAIAIIAILSSIGMVNFLGSQKKGRDVRRQSDLSQYRIALENYATVNGGSYPNSTNNGSAIDNSGLWNGIALNGYLTAWPTDPKPVAGSYDYYYRADASGTSWILQACMEAGVGLQVYQICSNGLSGIKVGTACAIPASFACVLP